VMLGGDRDAELVRHFLIETTSKGVRLKGCNSEPTFGERSLMSTFSAAVDSLLATDRQ